AFVDAEHAIDPNYARNLGVNIDDLILSQPDSGEQALSIVEMLANSDAFDMIVVDSVAALVPECELEGEMNDQTVGAQARLMSKALRKITAILNHHECTVIFINQLREKVGVMYGNPETTTGGRALKFYASVRIDIRRTEAIKNGSDVIGNSVNVKIVKNKVAPPFKNCKVDIIYGKGISQTGEILDVGVELGILTRVGSWYEYDGNRFANGRDNGNAYLEEHPDFKKELSDKIKSLIA
ncbi:MAG: recombinase RecA, partial [Bacilli bacterium]|nr:recombinase RecA [Bacilli bacterium]